MKKRRFTRYFWYVRLVCLLVWRRDMGEGRISLATAHRVSHTIWLKP